MTSLAPPRCARGETPSLTSVSGLLPAVMALGRRAECRIIALLDAVEDRRDAARTRRLLASFDDRRLSDIGLSRSDIERF